MSAERIDVLAVMDDATRMCGGVTDETGARVAEARAAVAELIEAASAGAPMKQDRGGIALYFTGPKAERLRAALARCGGA